jgi:O-antigen biosynthesis protein
VEKGLVSFNFEHLFPIPTNPDMTHKLALITGYSKDPEFVKTLLLSLNNQTQKNFDCYIYGAPNSLYFLEESFFSALHFTCHHLLLEENRGFAGNNNFTLNAAFKNGDYDYAVLVNDDTIPDENWLKELLKTAETSDTIGAVAPKMVFYQRFITLKGHTTTAYQYNRLLGLRYYLNTGFADSFYPKRFYTDGFFYQEEDEINTFKWTKEEFTIELPVLATNGNGYVLRLFLAKNPAVQSQSVRLKIGDHALPEINLEANRIYYEITVPKGVVENNWHYIIQNTGSEINRDKTWEIGFGEIDRGQYDSAREVSLFCGGACMLSKKALMETGLFMDGLFSYYEDSDLSIRLRKKGFRIIYNPESVIKHYHTGTSKEWSPLFTYYAFRNKIIFSAKTHGVWAFTKAFSERLRETYLYFKLYVKSRFRNHDYRSRLKLNLVILKDALIGIVKFKPKFLPK